MYSVLFVKNSTVCEKLVGEVVRDIGVSYE